MLGDLALTEPKAGMVGLGGRNDGADTAPHRSFGIRDRKTTLPRLVSAGALGDGKAGQVRRKLSAVLVVPAGRVEVMIPALGDNRANLLSSMSDRPRCRMPQFC